jgi:hypothetical protein
MGKQHSGPKSVREQIEDSAKDLWSSVMTRDISSNDNEECQHASLESMLRVMFGNCTTGEPSIEEPSTQTKDVTPQSSRHKEKTSPPPEPSSPKKIDSDAVYRALFVDNHLRAEEAVSHLREQMEVQRMEKAPSRPHIGKELPGMFPASSPKRHIVSNEPPKTIQRSQTDKATEKTNFDDDGISVITMHTLEEVAQQFEGEAINRVFSDITQDPIEEIEESWKQTIAPRSVSAGSPSKQRTTDVSSGRFGRSTRSHGTTQTKRSFGAKSIGTKSTNTTQTNDFVGVWLREEQKYWEDVVKEQEGAETALVEPPSLSSKHTKLSKVKDIFRKPRHGSSDRSHEQVRFF